MSDHEQRLVWAEQKRTRRERGKCNDCAADAEPGSRRCANCNGLNRARGKGWRRETGAKPDRKCGVCRSNGHYAPSCTQGRAYGPC
jgi:hypothetical protein